MNMDEIYKLCNGDLDDFIDKAEECGFGPDEIDDYLTDILGDIPADEPST